MGKSVVLDVETTTFAKGNPFSVRNSCVAIGTSDGGSDVLIGPSPIIHTQRSLLDDTTELIAFNSKFDIHWLRRIGYRREFPRIWDCQLAHFLLTGQQTAYPSLDGVCEYYGIPGKSDHIEREYWSKGIDTPDIPRGELEDYLRRDLEVTWNVYLKQVEDFKKYPQLYKLFRLHCADQKVLIEMEDNGLLLDVEKCSQKARRIFDEIQEIEHELNESYRGIPLNWDSHDHCSLVLYGGVLNVDVREVAGVYKTGAKIGQPRYRIATQSYILPRLFNPLPNTELKKDGYWSTDESILRQLRGKVPGLLIRRSELTKLLDYYEGYPELLGKMDWPDNILHGQLNQCVARTGRLSASNPNQQNIADEAKEIIVSRW